MFKSTLQIILGVAVVAQFAGCFFVGHDDRWHHDHDHDHDRAVVVVHG